MEVHAHSHTPRKKWTHYFWEFLMLFLAVTLGFFVENQREHMVEHQREKKFVRSLVRDLEADTTRLGTIERIRNYRVVVLDSFALLLNRTDAATFGRYLYYYNSFATRGGEFRFTPADGTMQQLKNAGNLRLIRKAAVSDSIVTYDLVTRAYVWLNNDEEDIMDTYRNIAEGVFDGNVLNAMRDEDNNLFQLNYDPPARLTEDAIFRLTYRIHMLVVFNKTLRHNARMMNQRAANLLQLLKKEYHLK